jgi:hypothetical protein
VKSAASSPNRARCRCSARGAIVAGIRRRRVV